MTSTNPAADLFAALLAVYNASNSFSNGVVDKGVRSFVRDHVDQQQDTPPYIKVDINITETDPMHNAALGLCQCNATFRLILTTARNTYITEEDEIVTAIRTAFDTGALTGAEWAWADSQLVREGAAEGTSDLRRYVMTFITVGAYDPSA